MKHLGVRIYTVLRLGVLNLLRVLLYKLGVKTGINSVRRLAGSIPEGEYFTAASTGGLAGARPREGWYTYSEAFGNRLFALDGQPPAWLAGCLSGQRLENGAQEWWRIPDFDIGVGDIKTIWEFSRFDWVITIAERAVIESGGNIARLNHWLSDWVATNPPYHGPNWKCGQETSIRVMHLAMASHILGQMERPFPALLELVNLHLQRIAPTLLYAIAQDNNHGTSEAAALFIGGSWLEQRSVREAQRYKKLGRKWLENRARRLIMADGSFSQYSVNYHRVMLDTYAWAELWRQSIGEPPFTQELYRKLKLATDWLANMVMSNQGDAPNVGANDGARLIPLTDTDYRDFRPSVQLATTVFHQAAAYPEPGDYDLPLRWLGLKKPEMVHDARGSRDYAEGGFAVLRHQRAAVLFRYPVFRFRPSQCDLLHVDLWVDNVNLLRDAGTYSYNSGDAWQDYFGSAAAHNTVQFDDRDQMPKLSRFLYGAWPKLRHKAPLEQRGEAVHCEAGFRDWQGAEHTRSVTLRAGRLEVKDKIGGFKSHATLRWRLAPGDWTLTADGVKGANGVGIRLQTSDDVRPRISLAEGQESRYYSQMEPLPVLEVTVDQACTIISEIYF